MKPTCLLLFAATLLLTTSACRKSTPVKEVSVTASGIAISEHDMTSVAGQWAQWRGPHGNGVVDDQAIPTSWSSTENVRWSSDVPGRGHSSPIVVGGLVVLGTAMESESKQMVVAYDQATGEKRWETVVHEGGFPNSRDVHQKATHANGTLASDGNLLVTAHLNSDRIFVTALDMNGEQVWQRDIGAFASKFGYAPSPILYKSFVIVAADNFGGGYLVALDLKTGEVAWRRKRGNANSYSSPAVATVGEVDQILITGNNSLSSYDPATGEPLWQTECISEATCGTVITTPDRIVASGGYPEKETVCLSATGEKLWSNQTKAYEPSLITDGQHVFAVSDSGIATCWQLESGEEVWKKRIGGKFSSSPVLCNGTIYVADLSGNCYLFEASGEAYKQLQKNQLGNDCYASPAVVDGAMYFRVGVSQGPSRREKLYCIGDKVE